MVKTRSSFYSEARYAEVNKENKNLLKDYELEMKSKRKGEKTIYQYMADIKMFFCWAYEYNDNMYVLDMKKRDFRRFFLELQENGASSARINRVQCSLRNMLEFASEDEDEYQYSINAMKSIKGLQREEVREIFFLTDEQIQIIIDALVEKGKYQQALYLTFSYESAARRNEIAQVEKHGFLENNRTNIVEGKRGKKFQLLYFNRSRELAAKYFEQRGEDDIDSLWTIGKGENKRPAKYETLYNWTMSFRKILEDKTGEYLEFNPHSFRHSALTNHDNGTHFVLKELGKDSLDLNTLRILANHSDVSTTQNYIKSRDDEILNDAFGL